KRRAWTTCCCSAEASSRRPTGRRFQRWALKRSSLLVRRSKRSRSTSARPCRESAVRLRDLWGEPVSAATRRQRDRRPTRQRDRERSQESKGDDDGEEGRETGRRGTRSTTREERTGADRLLEAAVRADRGDTGG